MLLECAIGDAYGAAFEFTSVPRIPNDLTVYGRHPKGGFGMGVGTYTDDTIRAVANALVILDGDPEDRFRPEAYMRAYQDAYRNDRRAGWSGRFQAMLEQYADETPQTFMRAIHRKGTNGCIMGVAPLGYLRDVNDVRLAATMQTVSTHAGSAAVYAQIIALAAHHLIHGGTTADVIAFTLTEAEWQDEAAVARFRRLLDDEPPVPAMPAETIAAGALWALSSFTGMADALKWACSRGGDTDSLAAVTMALTSCASDLDHDLPRHMLEQVDSEENRIILSEIDARLEKEFRR
jgi:ADP-ribosyl-[dinitrogen reductase] hydrolase